MPRTSAVKPHVTKALVCRDICTGTMASVTDIVNTMRTYLDG